VRVIARKIKSAHIGETLNLLTVDLWQYRGKVRFMEFQENQSNFLDAGNKEFPSTTTLAYIAGFLDGDGSVFFQIIPRKDYNQKFQIRSCIAFYQKTDYKEILEWLKDIFKAGYIKHRKTGVSDYTIVDSKEVRKILELLKPYVKLKKKQVELGLEIFKKIDTKKSNEDFLEICKLVDKFKELNYSKKRTITSDTVMKKFETFSENKSLPL
jgi:hypothetical protein